MFPKMLTPNPNPHGVNATDHLGNLNHLDSISMLYSRICVTEETCMCQNQPIILNVLLSSGNIIYGLQVMRTRELSALKYPDHTYHGMEWDLICLKRDGFESPLTYRRCLSRARFVTTHRRHHDVRGQLGRS